MQHIADCTQSHSPLAAGGTNIAAPTDTVHFQRTKDPTKRNKISYLILNFEFAIVPSDFFGNEGVKEFTPQSFGILVPAESKTLKCPDSFVQSRSESLVGIAR